jgi:hypothetical protein
MERPLSTLSRKHLVDELMAAYVDWRRACAHLRAAYRSWETARGREASEAYARYKAALAEEGAAAEAYACMTRQIERLVGTEDGVTGPISSSARQAESP